MSILSSTQGTPERVFSLLSAITTCGGSLDRGEAMALLDPGYTENGRLVKDGTNSAVTQTISAAISLGVVFIEKRILHISKDFECNNFWTFGSRVHDRLRQLPSNEKDAVVLETFAWVVVRSIEERRVGWMDEWNSETFADAADSALPEGSNDEGEQRRINSTKLAAWRRWLTAIGLNVALPGPGSLNWPVINSRMEAELSSLGFQPGQKIDADRFIGALASRMPYIDRGPMFQLTAARVGSTPPQSELSPITSAGLRSLHDRGIITLEWRGDASNSVRLTGEPTHEINNFHRVIVGGTVT